MQLAIGICAAPRPVSYLGETLATLLPQTAAAVHIFAEPGTVLPELSDEQVQIHPNKSRMGNWNNWLCMCDWLLSHTDSPFLMTVEDDVLFAKDAIATVSALVGQVQHAYGMISLYTSGRYRTTGWKAAEGLVFFQHPRIWGACCYLFPRESLQKIIYHEVARSWRGTKSGLSAETIDGVDYAVGETCRALGLTNFYCRPSLVQHIGAHSAVGNNQGLTSGRTAADFSSGL